MGMAMNDQPTVALRIGGAAIEGERLLCQSFQQL
jgi:hypothetical protein